MTREEAKELLIHILMTYEPKDQYGDLSDPEPYEQAVTMAIEALSAEAVQGEWKPFDLTWGRNVYFCTACKESTEMPTVNGQPNYNYCPNCGARMKGGEDE